MRPMQNNNPKRSRGRGRKPHSGGGGGGSSSMGGGGGGGGGGNPNRTIDSNGPDIKIRGTAFHIHEKYQNLARDAHTSGDYVAAENYSQHAEHYFRVLAANAQAQGARDASIRTANVNGNGNGNGAGYTGNPADGEQPDDSGMAPLSAGRIEVGVSPAASNANQDDEGPNPGE